MLFLQPIRLFCRKDTLHQKLFAFGRRHLLQQRQRAAVLRFVKVRAENILWAFHASLLRRDTAVNARSNPTAFTLSSSRKIVLQRPSLGLRWRLTTDAPPPNQHGGDGVQVEAGFHRGRQQMLCVLAPLLIHNVTHRLADRAGGDLSAYFRFEHP